MDSSRQRSHSRKTFKEPLERRVDQWIETGGQVVDGVAGNRPGIRRINSNRLSGSSFEKVGRWVGDKLDWFLEDEDAWLEPWQSDSQESYSNTKRPLDAISRRVAKPVSSSSKYSKAIFKDEEWPEESSFRVEKWRRSSEVTENVDSERVHIRRADSIPIDRRPLPRSSRRRS